jgi:GGDEF domain-containing protein
MAKTQCGVSLAFAALRKADGGFAIATFPTLTADPTWSVEAIDELVRQTWEDPHLVGGSVLVRSGRVLKGMWTGQGHHIKLAAAALSDPEAPDHPWGLLCVAEPLAGHFEQDQLNLLGNLAIRLTSYLRARQQVLEGSLSFEPRDHSAGASGEATPARFDEPYEPIVESPVIVDPAPSAPAATEAAPPFAQTMEPMPHHDLDDLFGQDEHEHSFDRTVDAFEPASENWGAADPGERRSDNWDFLGLEEIEWVEAAAPAPPLADPLPPFHQSDEPVAPTPSAPRLEDLDAPAVPERAPVPHPIRTWVPADAPSAPADVEQSTTFGTRQHEPAVPSVPSAPTGAGELDALLGPDPVTGLATLTTLVGRLSSSLAHVRNNEGTVGLILVDVSSAADPEQPLNTTALMTVAGRLTNHLRDRDLVARIGPALFAILVDLRPGAIDLESICQRSLNSLTAGMESTSGGLDARAATASAAAGSTIAAEDLLRQAADQLRR